MSPAGFDRADPSVRMVCGIILFGAVWMIDASFLPGKAALAIIAGSALMLHRGGLRRLAGTLAAGSLLYLPAFLLTTPEAAIKGCVAALTLMAPASGLTSANAVLVAVRLPISRHAKLLLMQMLHQSEVLALETRSVHRALTVRGGVRGIRSGLSFGRLLPTVWLPRVVFRAERVAVAMELRGYADHVPVVPGVGLAKPSGLLLVGTLVVAGAAVWLSRAGTA